MGRGRGDGKRVRELASGDGLLALAVPAGPGLVWVGGPGLGAGGRVSKECCSPALPPNPALSGPECSCRASCSAGGAGGRAACSAGGGTRAQGPSGPYVTDFEFPD